MKKSSKKLFIAVCLTAACVFQLIGFSLILNRRSDDSAGVILYGAALVGFAIAAVIFFIQWQREKKLEETRGKKSREE